MPLLADKAAGQNGPGLPLHPEHWWRDALRRGVARYVKRHGIRAPGARRITSELAKAGIDVSEDTVRRALDPKARMFSLELVGPLSKILRIPPPVILPDGFDHARILDAVPPPDANSETLALYLLAVLDSLRKNIAADDQTEPVDSNDGEERRV